MDYLDTPLVTVLQLKSWTSVDPLFTKVQQFALRGWPQTTVHQELTPYYKWCSELNVQARCVLWGAQVIIPKQGHDVIMDELHHAHPGMAKMKGLAQSYTGWPKRDADIESEIQSCCICQESHKASTADPCHPWEWWRRVHSDSWGKYF